MLYILTLFSVAFLVLNLVIAKLDFFDPSVIFCFMFLVYVIMCDISAQAFQIHLSGMTVLTVLIGYSIATIINFCVRAKESEKHRLVEKHTITEIRLPSWMYIVAICIELVTIIFFTKYLKMIADAWGSGGDSLSSMIGLYDTMTKFWTTTFEELAVPIPPLYRIGNPLTVAIGSLCVYILANNYVAIRKFELLPAVCVALWCVLIVLNGSRSPLLRVLTMFLILLYVFHYRKYGSHKIGAKNLLRLILVVLAFGAAMVLMLQTRGNKVSSGGLTTYLFTYIGAPIVNLDHVIKLNHFHAFGSFSNIFGEQTIGNIYAYLAKILHLRAPSIPNLLIFNFSTSGVEIGNVYTMYYALLYDFGYLGMIPMIVFMFCYYEGTYCRVTYVPQNRVVDFGLFIFSYLFNDIIMSAFSCRFFSTITDAPFLKLLLFSWALDIFIIEKGLRVGRYHYLLSGSHDIG